ncbi:MAG: HIT domain-containing protein [Candidatus Promineifilaceae bacterium]|nr:HIT domain-containing protein [Candidatus Promineifilaceae bacterium]
MSTALPLRRLYETETLLAFHHPQPSHAVHILIVPRRRLSGLAALGPADDDFMRDLFAAVNWLVAELELEKQGYRLVANGGAYQDVPHLHFHLLSDG